MNSSETVNIIRSRLVLIFCIIAGPLAADDKVSEEESQRYYFDLMQKAQAYETDPNTAGKYLHGVWRLDRKAHIGAGHYVRADKGDDVNLICNDERLIQLDRLHRCTATSLWASDNDGIAGGPGNFLQSSTEIGTQVRRSLSARCRRAK